MTTFSFEVFPPRTATGCPTCSDDRRSAAMPPTRCSSRSPTAPAGPTGNARSTPSAPSPTPAPWSPVTSPAWGSPSATSSRCSTATAALGVSNVVALRGDPPEGVGAGYSPHPYGYQRTADLVAAVKARGGFDVAVSAYPERHPQSPSIDHDLDVLAEKVAAGADRAITQMFFDNELLPPLPRPGSRHAASTSRSCPACSRSTRSRPSPGSPTGAGRRYRRGVAERFAGLDDDTRRTHDVAADLAAEQIAELAAHGVEHVHLYTLNRAELVLAVCERLGVVDPVRDMTSHAPESGSPPQQRILVLDGASGSEIQSLRLAETDLRGDRFRDHPTLAGRQPRPARAHAALTPCSTCTRRYLAAGADIITTNTFSSHDRRPARVRPRRSGADPRAQRRRPPGSPGVPSTRRNGATDRRAGSQARSDRPTSRCRCHPRSRIPDTGR